jgi:mannose-6-phosphate isomerase-like protein (cupin superfamily)
MPPIDRRTLLSTFGVAIAAPLLTTGQTAQSTSATRTVAMVPPGGNRFPYALTAMNASSACKLTADDSAGGCSAFELVSPTHQGPGLHVHSREDEWYYVLAGEFLFDVGEHRYVLPVGACVFAPRDIPHRWATNSATDGRILLVCQPGGFEKFFDALSQIPMNTNDADMKAMSELMKRFGLTPLGPPIFV